MKKLLKKALLPLVCYVVLIGLCGCNSMVKPHRERLERIYRAHDGILGISKKLQDIEQTMLYVGRIKDGPLADAALDVAIAIHGEPDDFEKRYAENITMESIASTKIYAMDLVKQREALKSFVHKEKKKSIEETQAMYAQEIRYGFLKQLLSTCVVTVICIIVVCFFTKKFF
ncbi:MAG: hypothetical protein LBC30_00135 [Puniceicoccales bacterium]|jgi:hypothetical protein|nr:hypothetical protein [Puniceicoccales bacterium]